MMAIRCKFLLSKWQTLNVSRQKSWYEAHQAIYKCYSHARDKSKTGQRIGSRSSSQKLRQGSDSGSRKIGVRKDQAEVSQSKYKRDEMNGKAELCKDLATILDFYRFTVTEFTKADLSYGHTTITPWEDASFLILHELALPYQDPITKWGPARLTFNEKMHLLNLIEERITTRKPTPYLVNGCYQQGEYFYVDERVLIPRSFIGDIIEKLVRGNKDKYDTSVVSTRDGMELGYEDYFGEIIDEEKFQTSSSLSYSSSLSFSNWLSKINVEKIKTVLDLCTGSGCLAILAAKKFPHIRRVDAVDLSKEALEVAEINVSEKGLDNIVHLFEGDLFEPLKANAKYDLIITNPPYVDKASMKSLPQEYLHEPTLALEGGADGLDIVKRIISQAKEYLKDDGFLICEIGSNRKEFENYFRKVVEMSPHLSFKALQWIETENSKDEVFILPKQYLP